MKNKLKKQLTNRLITVFMLILIQLCLIILSIIDLSTSYFINTCFSVFSYIIVIYIINRQDNSAYKIAWCVLVLIVPLFGGILYLLFGGRKVSKALRRANINYEGLKEDLETSKDKLQQLYVSDCDAYKMFNYGFNVDGFGVYEDTKVTFFASGEEKFASMLEELTKAQHFIFLEYFIIEEGKMWNSILEILEAKAKEGIKVKLIYDDFGCATNLPSNYDVILRQKGIECYRFNRLRPALAIQMNNRDHRKICVIDNNVGYCGGVNLADEYINETVRFGHWKDNAVMLKGKAVTSLTLMFLQMYKYLAKKKDFVYKPYLLPCQNVGNDGYVQPYCDSPTDNEDVGLNMHLNMISVAKKYVYIYTPYLVITDELAKALTLAARNGVDVRICVPHIPDKWYVFSITQNNYKSLIKAGVRIFEYTPGFVHAKSFIVDDMYGVCGTVNTDYRSYYLHFECGVLMYKCQCIAKMKQDYLDTLKVCQEVSLNDCDNVYLVKRIGRAILNLFAPLF
ncbi:MAG: cardiolipin synthase [Erysipelotrichaceae bacterium]|nr:cardiolipin synthase [Erysipelotrichaceae bacterium]MDY5252003.1 cardiolipin synthase [Erysipelotrichaceae bacterium]